MCGETVVEVHILFDRSFHPNFCSTQLHVSIPHTVLKSFNTFQFTLNTLHRTVHIKRVVGCRSGMRDTVGLFPKLDYLLFGCFDPKKNYYCKKKKLIRDDLTDVAAKTKSLVMLHGVLISPVLPFFTEISVSSPRKLFIFIICKNICWIKVSRKYFIYLEKGSTACHQCFCFQNYKKNIGCFDP